MKVLFKSLEELSLEYPVKEDDGFLFINDNFISKGVIKFFGKEAEAKYNEQDDSYIVGDYSFHPSFIKDVITDNGELMSHIHIIKKNLDTYAIRLKELIKDLANAHLAQYNYISIHNEYSKEINNEIRRIQEEYDTVCSLINKYNLAYSAYIAGKEER
jgi:hypothetical protein